MGTNLHDAIWLLLLDGSYTIAKTDRLAQMTPPVSRLREIARFSHSAGEIGNQLETRRREGNRLRLALKPIENGIHERRMKRVRNRKSLAADALAGKGCANQIHCRRRAGDDGLRRRIHCGYGDLASVLGDRGSHILFRCSNGRHGAAPWQGRHQRRASCNQPNSIFQAENARHCRGDDFADRMARDDARADAEGAPSLRQRIFDRKQPGLRISSIVKVGLRVAVGKHYVMKRPGEVRRQQRRATVERFPECRTAFM